MITLRSMAAAILILAIVTAGATAQDGDRAKTETKTVILKVVKPGEAGKACGPDCTKPCCAADERLEETPAGCGGKCSDAEKTECGGKCGDAPKAGCGGFGDAGPKAVFETGRVMVLGGGADGDVLKQALASLDAQVAKVKEEVAALKAAKQEIEAEKAEAKLESLVEHVARLRAMTTAKSGQFRMIGGATGRRVLELKDDVEVEEVSPRAFLGIHMEDVEGPGIRIVQTVDGSPAAQGGLKAEDVILVLNGEKIETPDQIAKLVGAMEPGAMVKLVVKRGDADAVFGIRLGAREVEVEEIEEHVEIEPMIPATPLRRPLPTRPMRAVRVMPGAGGGVIPGIEMAAQQKQRAMAAQLTARLQQVKAKTQYALAASDFVAVGKLAREAQEITAKLAMMNRPTAATASTAGLERRLAAVESRLARIEMMLEKLVKGLDR